MTPQGIASGIGAAAEAAVEDAAVVEARTHAIVRSIHGRISTLETSVLSLASAVPSKLERYGIPLAAGLLGAIIGHLI